MCFVANVEKALIRFEERHLIKLQKGGGVIT